MSSLPWDPHPGATFKGWPMGAEATDHFADAVLQGFHDGAQAVEFQDHAGEFVTGEATDGLQVLRFVASVVGADGGAGAVHHVIVEGKKDVGSGWETTCKRKASAADATSPCIWDEG